MQQAEYDKIDAINWTKLKSLRISPLQFQHDLTTSRDTSSLLLGRVVHKLVLEPQDFASSYCVWVGSRRAKGFRDFERGRNALGIEVITQSEYDRAHACAAAISSSRLAKKHLHSGTREQVLTWTDAETGVRCKARTDVVNGHVVEVKTAADIVPRRFVSAAARYGYHTQIAFYHDAVTASGVGFEGGTPGMPVMVVAQSDAPHDVLVYELGEEELEIGRRGYRKLLARYKQCVDTDSWPGISPDTELKFRLPAWASDDEPAEEEPALVIDGMEIRF